MSGLAISLAVEGQEDVSWAQWRELAEAAERLGFAGLYRSDHYLSELPQSRRAALDAWGTICALAALTTRLRLGSLVSPVTFRHPSVLAKLAVTADHISGGRIDLGIGAGWMREEHDAYGFPFPGLGERLSMLEEQVEIIRRSWTEGPFTFTGSHYRVNGLDARPRPVGDGHPPLVVGGDGGQRSVAIAASWADEYNTPLPTNEQIRKRRECLREACDRIGRDPGTLELSVTTRVIVGRDHGELDRHAERAARRDGRENESPAGYLADLRETCVVGTIAQAIERLREIADLGVRRVMLMSIDHADMEMIELIGTEILPAVQAF
jgi:F420-dependent oxidoreductase-like protein